MNKKNIKTIIAAAIAIGSIGSITVQAEESIASNQNEVINVNSRSVGKGQVINVSSNLNIRKSASTSATVVGKIPANATFEIIAKSGSWYKVKYGSVAGYVSGDYVKVILMPTTDSSTGSNSSGSSSSSSTVNGKGQVINVSSNLNIRKSASTSATVVGKIPANATFEIIAKSGSWYKVKYGSVTGYVSGDYVKVISMPTTDSSNGSSNSGNSGNSSDSSSSSGGTTTTNGKGQVINVSSSLNIRKSASTSATVVGKIPANATFEIIAKSGSWYKVKYGSVTGYVSGDYVKVISMPTTDNNTGSSNSGNSSDSSNSGNSSEGENSNNNSNTETEVSKYGIVVNVAVDSSLRVRKEPNTTSTVLGYLNASQKVEIVAETGSWYKIVFNDTTGYVSSSYIEIISYNPDEPQDSEAQAKFEIILNKMKTQLGSPYVYGGAGELITKSLIEDLQKKYPGQSYSVEEEYYDKEWRAFDCSGLMQWGFKEAGINLSRNTAGQITNGIEVSLDSLQPGDLIFYKTLNHVGMYIGDGKWIESPRTGLQVRIVDVPWSLVERARRVL